MTTTPMIDRDIERRDYWSKKHQNPEWEEDIHFALFLNQQPGYDEFRRGIELNTRTVCQEIMDRVSVHRISDHPTMLDFACGAGDLIIRMVQLIPELRAEGIDLSEPAISKAKIRLSGLGSEFEKRVNLHVGGVDKLVQLVEGRKFDIITCRDAYYMLDDVEQERVLSLFADVLRLGGILFIGDLAIYEAQFDQIKDVLVQRQRAGKPMTWSYSSRNKDRRIFSVVAQAARYGLTVIGEEHANDDAVYLSYQAASSIVTNEKVKEAYLRLADLASGQIGKEHRSMPYVRVFLTNVQASIIAPADSHVGVTLRTPFQFSKKSRFVLKSGSWHFPAGKWSLVIGRSGVGKTTLINILGKQINAEEIEYTPEYPSTRFILSQKPELIEQLTVQSNVRLFASSRNLVNEILDELGFDVGARSRKADDSLSGGEKQRVALGQAIVAESSLLLLDEPCTGIDRVRKYQFFAALRRRYEGAPHQTVICVDHDYHVIEALFDHVFEIFDGHLIQMR